MEIKEQLTQQAERIIAFALLETMENGKPYSIDCLIPEFERVLAGGGVVEVNPKNTEIMLYSLADASVRISQKLKTAHEYIVNKIKLSQPIE